MTKRSSPEVNGAFYRKYAAQLEKCLELQRTQFRGDASCKEVVKAAREELGYSYTTSAIDIISPLRRGYKVWKAAQGNTTSV